MKKERMLPLLLVAVLCVSLLAGCTQSTPANTDGAQTQTDNSAQTQTGGEDQTGNETIDTAEDSVFYNFAKDVALDANGFPTSTYAYSLPLTNSDEVLTYYYTCMYGQFLPDGGWEAVEITSEEEKKTGVHIEYTLAPYDTWSENYAIMMASDALCDIISKPFDIVTSMSKADFLEDHYIINLYDYKEYMPNYMYYTNYYGKTMGDANVFNTVFADSSTIYAAYSFYDNVYDTFGAVLRGDWLDDYGIDYRQIETVDDLVNIFELFKTREDCNGPWLMTAIADSIAFFGSFDTITILQYFIMPDGIVRDGVVTMPYYNEEDYVWMSTLADWYSKGYMDPGWAGYLWPQSYESNYANGVNGFSIMQCSEVKSYEELCIDPDCKYVPVKQPVRYAGQQIHLDYGKTYLNFAHTCVTPHCENIPLACTWIDWRYSDEGSFFYSYGPEGQCWEYDADGEIALTDFALNNPAGMPLSYVYNFYMGDFLLGHGVELFERRFAFPGGDKYYQYYDYWGSTNSDGAWNWPSGLTFSSEETEELAHYSADLITYLAENLATFVDGSRAMSTWDAFTGDLMSLGWKEVEAIYQEAYDNFMA